MNIETLFWDKKEDIGRLIQCLRREVISLGSSDTVLGFLAPLTRLGYDGLNEIKGRFLKPYIVLAGSLLQIENIAYMPQAPALRKLLTQCWPGPVTVILQAKDVMSTITGLSTVAVRIPNHQGLLMLLHEYGPVFSTSANKSGEATPTTIAEVSPDIKKAVCCIITNRQEFGQNIPSTIIDCSQEKLQLIREGAYSFDILKNMTIETNI